MRRGGHSYPALGKIGDVAYPGLSFVRRVCGADLWGRHAARIVVGCPRTDREFAPACCRRFQA